MKALSFSKNYQKAAVLVALVALVASAGLLRQFFSHGRVSGRAFIPSAEMQHASGFRYMWRVPAKLRASPWYRADVRILEDGEPLPLRVEDPDSVSSQGKGRFGVSPFSIGEAQKGFVWLSASDSTDPSNNGRKYEFEMRRTGYRYAILSAIFLAVSIIAILIAIPSRIRSRLIEGVVKPRTAPLIFLCCAAVSLAVLAGVTLAKAWPRFSIVVAIHLSAGRLIQSENQVTYRLPRWITEGVAQRFAVLYEDGRPLKRSSGLTWETDTRRGTFYCTADTPVHVCFRTTDGTNAALNGHDYTIKVPVFPLQLSPLIAVVLVFLILPLWIVITEKLKIARCLSWVSVGGAIRATAKRIEADPKDASTKLKESIVFTFFLLLLLYGMQRIHSRDRAPREPHLTTPATLETIELPLDITTDFLPAKQTITVSGGAIDYVGTNLFILAGF